MTCKTHSDIFVCPTFLRHLHPLPSPGKVHLHPPYIAGPGPASGADHNPRLGWNGLQVHICLGYGEVASSEVMRRAARSGFSKHVADASSFTDVLARPAAGTPIAHTPGARMTVVTLTPPNNMVGPLLVTPAFPKMSINISVTGTPHAAHSKQMQLIEYATCGSIKEHL